MPKKKAVWGVQKSRNVLASARARNIRPFSKALPPEPKYKNPELVRSFLSKMDAIQAKNFHLADAYNGAMAPYLEGASSHVNNPELFGRWFDYFMLKEKPAMTGMFQISKRITGQEITIEELKAYFYKTASRIAQEKAKKK